MLYGYIKRHAGNVICYTLAIDYKFAQKFPQKPTMTTTSTGPVESVWLLRFWPNQFFLKVKTKFQKASNKQSASVILGLVRAYYIKIE